MKASYNDVIPFGVDDIYNILSKFAQGQRLKAVKNLAHDSSLMSVDLCSKNGEPLVYVHLLPITESETRVQIMFDDWESDPRRQVWATMSGFTKRGRAMIAGDLALCFSKQRAEAVPDAPALPTSGEGGGNGEKESAKGIPTVQHLARLRQNIAEYFNLDELRTLCFDMGIKHENLAASTLDGMARELVDYCKRTDKLRDLVAKLTDLRPKVSWEVTIAPL